MWRFVLGVVALMCVWGTAPRVLGAPDEGKLDLGSLVGEKDDPIKSAMEDAGLGDNKEFSVNTDDNIGALQEGDLYGSSTKTIFKVTRIESKGASGGSFTVQRVAGTGTLDRKMTRISGVGPAVIVGRQTLLDLYISGGPFLHPIAILGVVTIILALNCLWVYRMGRQCPSSFISDARDALKEGDIETFEDLALRERGLLPVACRAMATRWETSTPEDIKERTEITAANQINRLKVPVKLLNLISAAAPLLGLLGTIVGMVIVFEAVASATGAAKAQALAAGIRVKLFSTAAALCVAIPSLFLYFFFNQRLTSIVGKCELLCEEFMHRIVVLKRKGASGTSKRAKDEDEDDDEDDRPSKSKSKRDEKEARV